MYARQEPHLGMLSPLRSVYYKYGSTGEKKQLMGILIFLKSEAECGKYVDEKVKFAELQSARFLYS